MKKLLLHSCCGPCSTHVIELLKMEYEITVLYFNPNIHPREEYEHRLSEQKRYCKEIGVKVIDLPYLPQEFFDYVKGLEEIKEGGSRCEKCFELRLKKTYAVAKEYDFDAFATTLTVSPHKNSLVINTIGKGLASDKPIFVDGNFKKQDGYKKSIELAKMYNLYRQNYCGCIYSLREGEKKIGTT